MRFTLQPYSTPSSRYHCPNCNDRARTFVRYIDTETGDHLADHVGRCGRENNCGYHFKPSQYFEAQGGWSIDHRPWSMADTVKRVFRPKRPESIVNRPLSIGKKIFKPKTTHRLSPKNYGPSTIDHGQKDFLCINPDIVNASFKQYRQNNFVQYLIWNFSFDKADELVGRYRIGTAKHWPGATVFWQIDALGQARTGKVMLYNKQTGKRVKEPFSHITWAHSLLVGSGQSSVSSDDANCKLATANFKLKQCLFGEHLLKEFPGKQVAIVESEKTAIIASAYDDSFIWLACGSISNLNVGICKVLDGRRVTLYPDLGAYDKWTAKALQLEAAIPKSRFMVSRILEDKASDDDRKAGLDIGDFLGRTSTSPQRHYEE